MSGIIKAFRWTVMAGLASATPLLWAAVAERVEYVADIDRLKVEVFAGALNAGGVLDGPLPEAGTGPGTGLCFLPNGEGFMVHQATILRIGLDLTVRLVAGTPGLEGFEDGPACRARLGNDLSLCADGEGGLFIGDRSNRCVRRLLPKPDGWRVETLAGAPRIKEWKGRPGDGNGPEAAFAYLHSNVVSDRPGRIYLMDRNFLRRVVKEGDGWKAETLNPGGGTGAAGKDGEPLASARFNLIMGGGICFGEDGCLYVADRWNHCIRKVDLTRGTVGIAVGPGNGYRDGPEKDCGFHDSPGHIVFDPFRNRFYTNGVDDWGVRTWEGGCMKTLVGGKRNGQGVAGPAREAGIHWGGVRAVDPRPPHDIYFWSGGGLWRGRIGRLYSEPAPAGAAKP